MSLSVKRRALFALLIVVTVWPAVHHVAALRWDLNPWRFFGLSMYAAPRPIVVVWPPRVRIARSGGAWFEPAPMPRPQQEELAEILHELGRRRTVYGRLLRTEDLREPLLEIYPRAHRVRVEFELMRLQEDRHVRAEVEGIEFSR